MPQHPGCSCMAMSSSSTQLVSVFDTSICDNNLGNQIIMEAVNTQLHELFPQAFFLRLPYLDSIGAESIRYIGESQHVFFGGTNALSCGIGNLTKTRR